jgi:uncharacterized membrane protein
MMKAILVIINRIILITSIIIIKRVPNLSEFAGKTLILLGVAFQPQLTSPLVGEVDVRSTAGEVGEVDARSRRVSIKLFIRRY